MTTPDIDIRSAPTDPIKLPPRKRPPLLSFALPATAIGSGVMLGLAVPNILNADDALGWAKALTLAFSATAVSYAVNKLAIERGAPLGTTGYHGASLLSIASILAVGGGLFAATYAGLTLKDAAELQLQEHGEALSGYVGERSAAAVAAGRTIPAIRAINSDLGQKAACEIATSCISGRGNGGVGTVARVVAEHAGRAASVAREVEAGDAARTEIVARLNGWVAEYQTILGDEEQDVWSRRARLQPVASMIRQGARELGEAVPLALIAAYAGELQAGARIAERPEAQARLNGILTRHGQSLGAVVESIDEIDAAPPAFPARTGVSDTFRYVHHFLPVAAIAAVVELVFPLVLWAYTFWGLAWGKYREQFHADRAIADHAVTMTDDEPDLPVAAASKAPRAEKQRRGVNGYRPRARVHHPDT